MNIKVLVTMHLYDDQEPDKDPLFKDGGWRRAIILARADYCPEVMIMGFFLSSVKLYLESGERGADPEQAGPPRSLEEAGPQLQDHRGFESGSRLHRYLFIDFSKSKR